ncbi:MAG TPA: efflux RND transporter periplasmic adaptor subunit [bacterium]|nr:efflux RND transporter periplasmic adaptor subunit [bacterium]
MKKNKLKIILIIFLAFLSWRIVLLVKGDSGRDSSQYSRLSVAVEVGEVKYAPIQEIREFTGTVYPLYQYIIAPKVSGRIVVIEKRIGDWVHQGEIIARIDDAEYHQAVLEAEANLRIAQASHAESESQFELARQELERVQSLQEKGIASPSELDTAITNFNALKSRIQLAKAQVEQRDAALSLAQIRLSYTVLLATEPGFIGERYVDEGSLLAPNSPVVLVVGIDSLIVRTTIIERDYGLIQVGQLAEIKVDAFPSKFFYGKVMRIAPMFQEASRVAQMEIEVANDSLFIKPGMFTRVRVILTEKDSAQLVPSESVVRRDGEIGVFVVGKDETVAKYFPVEVGITTQNITEIISPELNGQVVTLGQHLLVDGSPVILSRSDNKTNAQWPESISSKETR